MFLGRCSQELERQRADLESHDICVYLSTRIDTDIAMLLAAPRVFQFKEVRRTNRSYFAALAAVLLLFPICTLVPSIIAGAAVLPQEALQGDVNAETGEAEQTEVKLDMLHFTPSASVEDGIYYVARRGADPIAYFGRSEVYYVVGDTLIRLEFPGSKTVIPVAEELAASVTNYIFGSDPSGWRTGLRDCTVLRYADIYPGIDLVYSFLEENLKYEFVVAPLADPLLIHLRYPDADCVDVCDEGVTLSKGGYVVADTELMAFQEISGIATVECAFGSDDLSTISFSIGPYDSSLELIIDPIILLYGTYLGGSDSEEGRAVAVENGFVYVTGRTASSNFPLVNAYDTTYNGGDYDCFVTKIAADGQSLVYSSFLGGSTGWEDCGYGIAVEDAFAYVTGYTDSSDFPTVNAYDPTLNGTECFVTKFATDGQSLVYSTFLGGTVSDYGTAIAVENGYAYVTGSTSSPDFPTVNAYDSTHNGSHDCFVSKLAANGSSLVYSTFLGGTGQDTASGVAVENGLAYVTGTAHSSDFPLVNAYDSTYHGTDCFVTKFAPDGNSLVYSTYLGSAYGSGIAVENGLAYVTGETYSADFPTANAYDSIYNGLGDCFVTKLAANGSSLVYSTFLGGSSYDGGYGIAVEDGLAYVAGRTTSSDFPTLNAYDLTLGASDCIAAVLAGDGKSLIYSSFLGGTNTDYGFGIAVEDGLACITGYTRSSDFPAPNAYDSTLGGTMDCFVATVPNDVDTDMDGLEDRDEAHLGTNRLCIDSDNDNFLDGYEVVYGSDPLDPLSYPGMPQSWYDAIYQDLDGNATLIQQVISWLDGNHTAIESLFTFLEGNATLLIQTVNAVDGNSTQLDLLAALVTQDMDALSSLNATHVGDMAQIRAVLDMLGVTVGDSDCDGLDDLDEIALGTNILCIDTDCDNLNDAYEVKIGTDPTDDDSDNDTYYDGAEVLAGTDPLDSLDYPGSITTTTTTTQPPMGIELVIIAGAAGSIGIAMLLVIMKRRAATKSSA